MIKSRLVIFAAVVGLVLVGPAQANETDAPCARCREILQQISAALASRCEQVPATGVLQQQPIYRFLTVFDEVSQGTDPERRGQIYQAALDGMHCDDINAGVRAAQSAANRLLTPDQS